MFKKTSSKNTVNNNLAKHFETFLAKYMQHCERSSVLCLLCLSGTELFHMSMFLLNCAWYWSRVACCVWRWFAPESCHDGYVGRIRHRSRWDRTAGNELQDCDSGNSGSCAGPPCDNNFICLMRVLGKPFNFAADETSRKGWSFVMLSFTAAVSPERKERLLTTCGT